MALMQFPLNVPLRFKFATIMVSIERPRVDILTRVDCLLDSNTVALAYGNSATYDCIDNESFSALSPAGRE